MNLVQVPAPTASFPAQWWPDLHLKQGRKLQPINIAQCATLATEYRNRAMSDGRGASETPTIKLHDKDGRIVARILWNGRVQTTEGMFIE